MPIYEYRCQACGHMVELLQKMNSQSAGEPCPACGGTDLRKVISAHQVGKSQVSSRMPACSSTGNCVPSGGCCSGCGMH